MNSYDKLRVHNQIVLLERINKTHFERFVKNEIRNLLSDPVNSMNISKLKSCNNILGISPNHEFVKKIKCTNSFCHCLCTYLDTYVPFSKRVGCARSYVNMLLA